ncbi:MAG: trigger factor [Pseudomonadales bacterium]|nr:trigger factor [Pseudomonadales bacterium]MCP5333103.1 trigger factor [Pseudomonadales bacterium]HMZ71107.1 trigger factor [Pseudomonadales bacterium]HNF08602.1 trigger factor [Pseudomonadales bacterium]HNI64201.1 trigger factor [Pseudomonadales bacterium]
MQVSVEAVSVLGRRLTIDVPVERIETEVSARLLKAARTMRLDGFRPGKVPLKLVRERIGEGVRSEVLGDVINDSLNKAIVDQNLIPAGRPMVEAIDTEQPQDLRFVATFEIYPTVDLADFSVLNVQRLSAEVTEADVDKMIETIRKSNADWTSVQRAAANGDQLTVDFEGFVDGEPLEGGSASGAKIVLGSQRMIPGFEDGLIGAEVGAERTLDLKFPEPYHNAAVAGKDARFKVKVQEIEEQTLPEIGKALFERVEFDGDSVEAFRAEVRSNMEREMNAALRRITKQRVMKALEEAHSFDLPGALVGSEIQQMRHQLLEQMGHRHGHDCDHDHESDFPSEIFAERAQQRVKRGLILAEIIKGVPIKSDPSRVRLFVEELASSYREPERVVEWYYQNPEMISSIEALVLEDQAIDHVLANTQVSDEATTYEAIIREASEAANG